jgi:hypothetical protein
MFTHHHWGIQQNFPPNCLNFKLNSNILEGFLVFFLVWALDIQALPEKDQFQWAR